MAEEVYITRDMNTKEMLDRYPEAKELLEEYGMMCTGCMYAGSETLEEALAIHCVDIDAVIDALNEKIRDSR
jgi:hybrid cluster-associated redox disulfide protein